MASIPNAPKFLEHHARAEAALDAAFNEAPGEYRDSLVALGHAYAALAQAEAIWLTQRS
ncbi:hypothetical protein AB2L28_20605 [Kineococcus sp. TBRC 1896]|uniref:Uncharacterized protein n=1 Tax=Kineococcus mangrovi TaxID=1660183 RepID=A0ABV4I7H5_9ACTN